MNGRLYDPLIARFISADPIIADPLSVQAFNRYSYVDNNPLTYTDPTGYLKLGGLIGRIIGAVLHPITLIPGVNSFIASNRFAQMTVMASSVFCGPYVAACAAGNAAYLTGIQGGSLGDMFKAAALAYVGAAYDGGVIGNAIMGCVSATVSGGKCGAGALSAGFTSVVGPMLPDFGMVGNVIARSMLGGVGSVIGGGKFVNGAFSASVTTAFGHVYESVGGSQSANYVRRESGRSGGSPYLKGGGETAQVNLNGGSDYLTGVPEVSNKGYGYCFSTCTKEALGVDTVVGITLIAGDGIPIQYPRSGISTGPGRSSLTSSLLRDLLSVRAPMSIPTPSLGSPLRSTPVVGAALARWTPYVGYGMLSFNAIQHGGCMGRCMGNSANSIQDIGAVP